MKWRYWGSLLGYHSDCNLIFMHFSLSCSRSPTSFTWFYSKCSPQWIGPNDPKRGIQRDSCCIEWSDLLSFPVSEDGRQFLSYWDLHNHIPGGKRFIVYIDVENRLFVDCFRKETMVFPHLLHICHRGIQDGHWDRWPCCTPHTLTTADVKTWRTIR